MPLASRSNAWRRGPSRASRWSAALVVALCVAIVAVGALLWFLNRQHTREVDASTLCPKDGKTEDVTALLLDVSDPLAEAQRATLKNELIRVQQSVPRFGLLSVYALDGNVKRLIRPVVELCNPGDGSDLNDWYQNPQLAKRKWSRDFAQTLDSELERVLDRPATATSPILEAIQAVAVETFDAPRNDHARKRLLLVSDMMQNVPGKMNQYIAIPTFSEFNKTPYYNEVRADLNGVEITICYVVRPRAPQKWPEHRLFWEQYFAAQGATVQRIEPLYGVQ